MPQSAGLSAPDTTPSSTEHWPPALLPKTVPFAKVLPGGNPTILVPAEALQNASLPFIAQQLMSASHLQAEQVGSLSSAYANAMPHLQMMGGEFCVNATRASAAILANDNMLHANAAGCHAGYMTVSGVSEPVLVATAPSGELLANTIEQFSALSSPEGHTQTIAGNCLPSLPPSFKAPQGVAANPDQPQTVFLTNTRREGQPAGSFRPRFSSISMPELHTAARLVCTITPDTIEKIDKALTIVHLPGISHLLVATPTAQFPPPDACAALAATYRSAHNLENLAASGVIWYSDTDDGFTILPVVYVKDTDSTCVETACGSASLALGLYQSFLPPDQPPIRDAASSGTNSVTCPVTSLANPVAGPGTPQAAQSSYAIKQPSRETLTVTIIPPLLNSPDGRTTLQAWVSGRTHVIATGIAHLLNNTSGQDS